MIDTSLLPERFWTKVRLDAGCWVWTAAKDGDGYAHFDWHGEVELAHRVAYQVLVGPIPDGLTLDHLCRVRACVNPQHLEPVTNRENLLRGNGFSGVNARKTHCAKGHAYDEANTYHRPSGGRDCRKCNAASTAKYLARSTG